MRTTRVVVAILTLLASSSLALQSAQAADTTEKRIEELERRIEILAAELQRMKETDAVPEDDSHEARHGLFHSGGSATATAGKRLSIGGYGQASYKSVVGDRGGSKDTADLTRLVFYVGYKFTDRFAFSSEIEIENATTGEGDEQKGEVSVEFAQLDALLDRRLNLRGGLVLLPVGFINEMHEPPFFHGNRRPEVERRIIPTTWRANGVGMFGRFGDRLSYRTYVVTSLDAQAFRSNGVRAGRQSGSKERAESFSWVGRLDYEPLSGLSLGGSAYLGNQGQNRTIAGAKRDVFSQLYEAHARFAYRGLELRGLATVLSIGDARALSIERGETIAKRMLGYYGEAAYNVLPLVLHHTDQYLAPWLRYSRVDTQHAVPNGFTADETQDAEIIEVGLTYKPIARIVLKLDYRIQNAKGTDLPEELRLGGGFEF